MSVRATTIPDFETEAIAPTGRPTAIAGDDFSSPGYIASPGNDAAFFDPLRGGDPISL
jgi:hypothetical protein